MNVVPDTTASTVAMNDTADLILVIASIRTSSQSPGCSLGLHDKDFPLEGVVMELAVDVTPEFELLPREALRQLKAKGHLLPWVDAEPRGRVGIDQRRFTPELEFHLREHGGDELMGQLILVAEFQNNVLARGQGEARVRIFPRGVPLDHLEGLLLDGQNDIGLVILTLRRLERDSGDCPSPTRQHDRQD